MPLLEGDAGFSLAKMYRTVGRRIGVSELQDQPILLVHDMSQVVFSERFSLAVRRFQATGVAQSTNFEASISDLPDGVSRVLGIFVFSSSTGQLNHANVGVRHFDGREFPLWWWQTNIGSERSIRLDDDGDGSASTLNFLQPSQSAWRNLPGFAGGSSQPESGQGETIYLRGQTNAFGAGSMSITALVHLAFTEVPAVSSLGQRIPSW